MKIAPFLFFSEDLKMFAHLFPGNLNLRCRWLLHPAFSRADDAEYEMYNVETILKGKVA